MQELITKYREQLLHSIPVVSGMDLSIKDIEPQSILIQAPLNPNINYEGTAFGGSLNTCCVLASFLLVQHLLRSREIEFNSLVIQDSSIKYLEPVDADFIAKSSVSDISLKSFLKCLDKRGQGRIQIQADVFNEGNFNRQKVSFLGRFVASK